MGALIAFLKSDANAANAFGAVASAAAAFLALVVSIISVYISVRVARSQKTHNELSVRPLAEFTIADYEDCLRVTLCNNGTGPMLVTKLTATRGSIAKPTIMDWMPSLPVGMAWDEFTGEILDRTLPPGGSITLLEFSYDNDLRFAAARDSVRAALAPLILKAEYTNIYNTKVPDRTKNLSWFGRNLTGKESA